MKPQIRRTALCLTFLLLTLSSSLARELSFEDRVAAQRAIEDVYWQRRIWPAQNHGAKPPLDEVLPESAIRAKVSNYIGLSDDLASAGHPISEKQLQQELNRMVAETKAPEVLRELFAALGDDPLVIRETLVRQKLMERLELAPPVRDAAEAAAQWSLGGEDPLDPTSGVGSAFLGSVVCGSEPWSPTSNGPGVPTSREKHIAVWTGSEMIIWGGGSNTGGRYNPATDSWAPTTTTGAPEAVDGNTAVWTGSEMIIWGGLATGGSVNTGGRYDPMTDTWAPTSTASAPEGRQGHTSVWSGAEMIIWGGDRGYPLGVTDTGGRYNPASDTWTPTSVLDAPGARYLHTAVWTGSEMIIWGGLATGGNVNTGGRYNPMTDSWAPTSTASAPGGRRGYTAVWSGAEMIIWGGNNVKTGGRYNPATDSWVPTTINDAPEGRSYHTAVWTGSDMIIWGGHYWPGPQIRFNTGGRYFPEEDTWTPTPTTGAPEARFDHTAVWAGSEMIIWGGFGSWVLLNSGGRYCAGCDDGNPCTSDSYDPDSGCLHSPNLGEACDDLNGCTTADACDDAGRCVGGPSPGAPCDDGIACTTNDTCDAAGTCIPGQLGSCDDGNTCTFDLCTPTTGCTNMPTPGSSCDDDNACTTWSYCDFVGPACVPGGYLNCDDGTACTFDGCSPTTGCFHLPNHAFCDDGIACTFDGCDPTTGCFHTASPWLCDDHNVCNGLESCAPARGCVAGTPLSCDDGNNCTDDSCDPALGCVLVSNHSCDASPQGLGYWKRLCEAPVEGEGLTNFDADCVNNSCTFSGVASVADLCDRLYANPNDDKCEQGEAEFMALQLNACRLRVDDAQTADAKKCTSQTTVGGIRAEADSLLCNPARDQNACVTARCESEEVNLGKAF